MQDMKVKAVLVCGFVALSLATSAASQDLPCPGDMVEVSGLYCPRVEQKCLKWLDPDNPGANGPARCAEFAPTKCLSTTLEKRRFCIDRYEWPNRKGELPAVLQSWYDAKAECSGAGKRLCLESEFTFACEGPAMKPYPYGDGFHRDSNACNIDKKQLADPVMMVNGRPTQRPLSEVDQRVPSGSNPDCHSDFGVYDIVGNADEWVINESGKPYVSGLKSGHWVEGARNRCRPMTDAHGPEFSFYVTGFRCCKDVH